MSRALSPYSAILATLLLIHSTEIGCCSLNTNEINFLMSQNPNYRNDPCYIEWKASEDAKTSKLTQVLAKPKQKEKPMTKAIQLWLKYESEERERQQSYITSSTTQARENYTMFWLAFGMAASIVAIICCCVACFSEKYWDDPNDSNAGDSIPVSLTFVEPYNIESHQRTYNLSSNNDNNFHNLNVPPSSQLENVVSSLMPTNTMNTMRREDSLPSYEDAIRMAPIRK